MKKIELFFALIGLGLSVFLLSGCFQKPQKDPKRVFLSGGPASFVPPRGFLEAGAEDFEIMKKQLTANSRGGIYPLPLYLCRTNGTLFAVSVLSHTNQWLPSRENMDRYMDDFKNYLGRKGNVFATNSFDRGMARKIIFLNGSDFDVYKCVLWGKSRGGRGLETAVEIDTMVPKDMRSEKLHQDIVTALNTLRIE